MRTELIASFKRELFSLSSVQEFNDLALRIFRFQLDFNPVYAEFVESLGIESPADYQEIPCLPILGFKQHKLTFSPEEVQTVFKSSGTSGQHRASHYISDLELYRKSFTKGFKNAYGPIEDMVILALLPNYIEQGDSSLVYMVDSLIEQSKQMESGFYLEQNAELAQVLQTLKDDPRKVLLIGVTYALIEFVGRNGVDFPDLIVMETGGMKGRRKELIREEVHALLTEGFGVQNIHSEYGMTELLSQAYSKSNGLFKTPEWMRVMVRDIHDPLQRLGRAKTGGIDVIDLANMESCPFIATDDLGRLHADGAFEVLGRFDNSDIRGCSLLV